MVEDITKAVVNALAANMANRCGTHECDNEVPEGLHYVARMDGTTEFAGTEIAICIDCAKVVEELLHERRREA